MDLRLAAVGALVVGMGLTGASVYRAASYAYLVDEGVEAVPDRVIYFDDTPAAVFTVQGEQYTCTGWAFDNGDWVVYDPEDPDWCRPESAVGGFDANEGLMMAFGAFGVILAVVMWVLWRYAFYDPELDAIE